MTDNIINLADSGVKLGIIGTNFISDSLCEAAKQTGLPVTAVFSRKRDTGEVFAKRHQIENVFCNFDDFCESTCIDAAYIASPNFCHFEQSRALLMKNKHVLCEKPAATAQDEFRNVRELANEKNLIYIEAMRPVYDPALDIIRSLLPKCGTLRYAHLEYSQYSSRYDRFKNGIMTNAFEPSYSNAAVMDIGVYPIHICTALFGKPKSVISRSLKLSNGFEGQGSAVLGYEGMTVEIAYSKITEAASGVSSFIRGENGEISFGHALSKINEIYFAKRGENAVKQDFSPAPNNMIYELCAFCDFVNRKKKCDYFLNCTDAALSVIDEIRRQNDIIFPSGNN